MREVIQQRVLGAVRFVDVASRALVDRPLVVTSDNLRFLRNRRGLQVIVAAAAPPRLAEHESAWPDPPATPTAGSERFEARVVDPSGRYLPRSLSIDLPRAPDPEDQGSLFEPLEIELFPSPSAPIEVGWAVIRASVYREGSSPRAGLPFALLLVVDRHGEVLARGVADQRGEALVAVPGIPVTTWSEEPSASVTRTTLDVEVLAYYDPAGYDERTGKVPDPANLELRRDVLSSNESDPVQLSLASGREKPARIALTVTS